MADQNDQRPLRTLSEAFKELAATIDSQTADVDIASPARSLSFPLSFAALASPPSSRRSIWSPSFRFRTVKDITEASKTIRTLEDLLEEDIMANTVRKVGSHSRNLLKLKRGVDMVRAIFENILATGGDSLRDPASKAYLQVFENHHGWAIRKVAGAAMYSLPTLSELWKMINEDGEFMK
ncbi:hypothetical protein CJ030_MR2G010243 [Morella rubra]|uniref:Glycolipid transfer protein domain-containing protein n=1 Tax=Morella rubra TaxID=262757 RepID=A0A6A1WE68_9ROSI|nr:hypothetical protein CJ030_MR2G010243 [Morella rubra]